MPNIIEGKDILGADVLVTWHRGYVRIRYKDDSIRPNFESYIRVDEQDILKIVKEYAWKKYTKQGSAYRFGHPIMDSAYYDIAEPAVSDPLIPIYSSPSLPTISDCPPDSYIEGEVDWCGVHMPAHMTTRGYVCSRRINHHGPHHAHSGPDGVEDCLGHWPEPSASAPPCYPDASGTAQTQLCGHRQTQGSTNSYACTRPILHRGDHHAHAGPSCLRETWTRIVSTACPPRADVLGDPICNAEAPSIGFVCTRERGHTPPHHAHGDECIQVWE